MEDGDQSEIGEHGVCIFLYPFDHYSDKKQINLSVRPESQR